MNFSFMPIIFFFYEETAELTLEEVDELFRYTNMKRGFREITPFNHRKSSQER